MTSTNQYLRLAWRCQNKLPSMQTRPDPFLGWALILAITPSAKKRFGCARLTWTPTHHKIIQCSHEEGKVHDP